MSGSYRRVEGASCELCNAAIGCTNPLVRCPRCASSTCRRCFRRACAIDVAGIIFTAPILSLRGESVCDACEPDAAKERAFRERYLSRLVRGEIAERSGVSLLSSAVEPMWLQLDTERRTLRWRSMRLINQQPAASGDIPLASIATVAGVNKGSSSGSSVSNNSSPDAIKLVDGRGRLLLQFSLADARQQRIWEEGLAEAVSIERNSRGMAGVFGVGPSAGGAAAGAGSAGTSSAASTSSSAPPESSSASQREARTRSREAFRASLGDVGMSHTARILAARSQSGSYEDDARREAAANADVDDVVNTMKRLQGGANGGPAGNNSAAASSSSTSQPPLSGSVAASRHSIRTGDLNADRLLNGVVSGVRQIGSSAASALAGLRVVPPPGGSGSSSSTNSNVASSQGISSSSGSSSATSSSSSSLGGRGGPSRVGVGRGSLHSATAAPSSSAASASLSSRFASAIASASGRNASTAGGGGNTSGTGTVSSGLSSATRWLGIG